MAWASSIKEGASVAMKVVIRTICSMGKVTSCVSMVEVTRANGVKGKDVGLEDKYCVRLSSGGMRHDVISGATTACIDLSSMSVGGKTINDKDMV